MFSSLNGGRPNGIGRPGIGLEGQPPLRARRRSGGGSCGSRRSRIRGRCPRVPKPGRANRSSERRTASAWPTAHSRTLSVRPLRCDVVGVLVVVLLQRGEQVELERDPRMAGGHHPVGDELAAARRCRNGSRGRRRRAPADRRAASGRAATLAGVGAGDRVVAREPARRPGRGRIRSRRRRRAGSAGRARPRARGRVAAEARRRARSPRRCPSVAAICRPRRLVEHRQARLCAPAARRRLLPGGDLVLADDRAVAFGAAVAGRAGARWRRRCSARRPAPSPRPTGRRAGTAPPPARPRQRRPPSAPSSAHGWPSPSATGAVVFRARSAAPTSRRCRRR